MDFDSSETAFSLELSYRILKFMAAPPFNVDKPASLGFVNKNGSRSAELAE